MNESLNSFNIAVVEDDAILREELAHFLRKNGHVVTELVTGLGLEELLTKQRVDVVILDLNLPGISGFGIAIHLKTHHPEIGILMLTARTGLPDRVKSYNSGADIYLPKPTAPLEILAAVNSLGRRLAKPVLMESWRLSTEHHSLFSPDSSQKILLSPIEEALLICLCHANDLTQDADTLCEVLSKKTHSSPVTRRALENIISRLRKKLADCMGDDTGQFIRSVRGIGYQLCLRLSIRTDNPVRP
jgi:two-component system OmpR family response regulator